MFSVAEITDKHVKDVEDPEYAQWSEIPLSFKAFCKNEEHMAFPKLSARQLRACYKVLYGVSFKKFLKFSKEKRKRYKTRLWEKGKVKYNINVLLWGKGSGKDTISSIIICYLVYTLLCLKNAQKYFGMPVGESIDMINVAYSSQQAREVFFEKFKQRVLHWRWLDEKYPIKQSGKYLNESADTGDGIVKIGVNGILFPSFIRVFSRHSEQESSEGLNLIAWVADEIAAFSDSSKKHNGKKMFNMLRTSAHSRFPGDFRGLAISYPRFDDDPIMWLYDLCQKVKNFFGDKGSTWEINPTKTKEDFEEERILDPEDYAQKYMCIPPKTQDAFFKHPERIAECISPDTRAIATLDSILIEHQVIDQMTGQPTGETKLFTGNQIDEFFLIGRDSFKIPRVAHVDAGLVKDRAALVIAHGEPITIKMFDAKSQAVKEVTINMVVEDLIVVWQPDKKRKLQVSLDNIQTIIFDLMERGIRFKKISYDQWNSASSLEAFARKGIPTEKHNISTDDYKLLRNVIYAGGAKLLPYQLQQHELEKLQFLNGRKVDHPEEGSKEIADCLAGVNRLLNDFDQRQELDRRMPSSRVGVSTRAHSLAMARRMGPDSAGITSENPLIGHPGAPQHDITRMVPMAMADIDKQGRVTIQNAGNAAPGSLRNFPDTQKVRFPRSSKRGGGRPGDVQGRIQDWS